MLSSTSRKNQAVQIPWQVHIHFILDIECNTQIVVRILPYRGHAPWAEGGAYQDGRGFRLEYAKRLPVRSAVHVRLSLGRVCVWLSRLCFKQRAELV